MPDMENRLKLAYLYGGIVQYEPGEILGPRLLSDFEPFTLDQLAACAHVTTKHLCRVFTKELGVSPMKACRLMQFQLAIPLLARTHFSIREIAERCGFPDQLYFSRTFSQTCGLSPSQARR